ncbi:MAG: type II secretion system F family protein [Bdellovibrionota bacterium]|nr:MAG: type II secretion system F family protein [Bdellovibrionota bacterium]
MTTFVWEGRNSQGKEVSGEIEARDIQAVFNILKNQRITPNAKKIREKGKGLEREVTLSPFAGKIKGKDIVIFTRQLATMIDAGLPIVQALDILGRQQDVKAFKTVLNSVKESVETGETFAAALAKHPRQFDDLFVNMVSAGENGGILDVILERLARYLEKAMKLKREIQTAMIYPAVVIGCRSNRHGGAAAVRYPHIRRTIRRLWRRIAAADSIGYRPFLISSWPGGT